MTAFIALGSNLPYQGVAPPELLARAVGALAAAGVTTLRRSSIWETEPWPPELKASGQASFFNAVVEVDPGGREPQAVYALLREIETGFGRERRELWSSRTLDLDLLSQGDWVGAFGEVALPHPRLHERAFVLAPLSEVAPDWRHPLLGKTPEQMRAALPAGQQVKRWGTLPGAQ